MNGLLPFMAGLGILLIYSGVTAPPRTGPGGLMTRLEDLLAGAGFTRLSVPGVIALCGGCGVMSFLVLAGITGSGVIAGTLSLVALYLPISFIRTRRVKRLKAFREAWPDAIATLIAAVRSGVSLPEACMSLTRRGPAELAAGFEAFAGAYRATGSFSSAVTRMREFFSDPVADRIAVALMLARDVGGSDLVRLLRALGDFVREDLRVRKEVQARWSWTITAARVAAAAPWIVLVLMASRPEAAAAYNSPAGIVVITAGAGATLLGYRLMLLAGRLPEDKRLPS